MSFGNAQYSYFCAPVSTAAFRLTIDDDTDNQILDNDSYLDVNIRNLIVTDDQIIEASKNNRIVNAFTKGCHVKQIKGRFFFLKSKCGFLNVKSDFAFLWVKSNKWVMNP